MLTIILITVVVILVTIGLVKLIDKFIPTKFKPVLTLLLWGVIAFLGYETYMSVYEPIKFNKEKNKRYAVVIESLKDIRDAQLAHREVTGKFSDNFESLIKFVDTANFTITQRRDSTVVDEKLTKLYGVDTTKEIIIVDTLGTASIKDSLFKETKFKKADRYKTMMNVPIGEEGAKFEMKSGFVEQNKIFIPVFEASVTKNVILFDQNRDLLIQENQIVSVDGVNGDALKVGSMDEVKTNGNWPITYGDNE